LAEDPPALARRREQLETLLGLLPAQRFERFKLAASLARPWDRARQNLGEVLPIWLSFWRDVFLRSAGGEQPLANVDLAVQVDQVASQISSSQARALVVAHEQALDQLDAYVNVQLLAETLLLQWPMLIVAPIGDDINGESDD
jgi:hypothetical protein